MLLPSGKRNCFVVCSLCFICQHSETNFILWEECSTQRRRSRVLKLQLQSLAGLPSGYTWPRQWSLGVSKCCRSLRWEIPCPPVVVRGVENKGSNASSWAECVPVESNDVRGADKKVARNQPGRIVSVVCESRCEPSRSWICLHCAGQGPRIACSVCEQTDAVLVDANRNGETLATIIRVCVRIVMRSKHLCCCGTAHCDGKNK